MFSSPSSSSSSSHVIESKPSVLFSDIGYPRHCGICPPSIIISDRFEFAHHLRQVHCTKEGGSFICRYGPNGVCQTLPLEGVSDRDYEVHLRKYHTNVAVLDKKFALNAPSSEEIASTMSKTFTVHSFTQNLSSVLADPKRSRSETHSFFTRHWGESFVPKSRIHPSSSLPTITIEHFKKYLTTTAKNHKKYLKAKKALGRTLARHEECSRIDANDVPVILLNPHFSLADPETFEAIFLEPTFDQPDRLSVDEKLQNSSSPEPIVRAGSVSSLTPSLNEESRSTLALEPFEASNGRYFRRYKELQNRLEYYHDLVDSRLNNQLASKSNAFWKTVISYGSLYSELSDARNKVTSMRKNLQSVNEKVYLRIVKVMELYKARQQKQKLLHKLQDIACLRDAQITVQMLLNQNDYPKALECIETAQDVLGSELRGVVCFRHLSTQLQELYKVIGRMLQEEFVSLIQKEFGRPCETESEAIYQEGQLNPIVLGLLRVREYKFVHVLQQEIVEAVKNSLRQIVKAHVVKNLQEEQMTECDPSLLNLSSQMRKLDFTQWLASLENVLRVLFYMCRRVLSIQELIAENIDKSNELFRGRQEYAAAISVDRGEASLKQPVILEIQEEQTTAVGEEIIIGDDEDELEAEINELLNEKISITSRSPMLKQSSTLSLASLSSAGAKDVSVTMPHSYSMASVVQASSITKRRDTLLGNDALEGVTSSVASTPAAVLSMPCRNISQVRQSIGLLTEHAAYACQERSCRLLVARSKDGFLERLSVSEFHCVRHAIDEFINKCHLLVGSDEKYSSPLKLCIIQQSSCFIKRFHEDRKAKLGNILDSENWRASEVPEHFQRIVDECLRTERLRDVPNIEGEKPSPQQSLNVDGEAFIVVGTALLLLQMMSQYCDALAVLNDFASELLMCMVELLKSFNSRSCQLILGAGALQLIGLKSISVRHLALSSRCLQLILRFVPYVKADFERNLGEEKQNQLRHMNQVVRDYNDHVQEITNKLVSVIEHHIVAQLHNWEVKGSIPSPAFQQICRQLGKFYSGLTGIMPETMIRELFLRVHETFKSNLKEQLASMGITPHDSLTYGLVSQEYSFYIKSLQSMPCCKDFHDESISEALYSKS